MKLFFSVLLSILLLTACGAPRLPLPPAPAAEILLQQLASTGQRWQQIDAAAKVSFQRQGKYLSTRQFLLVEKPDQFRVDVLSLFGQLALQLTVTHGELEVLLNTTVPGQFYRGPASPEMLSRFTRLPLSAADLVRLLLYDPPRSEGPAARVEVSSERYLLRLGEEDNRQQFFFDERLQLRRCVYLHKGEPQLVVDYAAIDKKDGFPRQIQVEIPGHQTRVLLHLSEVKLNQPTKRGRFKLTRPKNAVPLLWPEFRPGEESP